MADFAARGTLVAEALGHCGWSNVDPGLRSVVDLSGNSGDMLFKVSTTVAGARPSTVALKVRHSSAVESWCTEVKCTKMLAGHGLALDILASGGGDSGMDDWYIVEWVAATLAGPRSHEWPLCVGISVTLDELATCLAKMNMIPSKDFEELQEQEVTMSSAMRIALRAAPFGYGWFRSASDKDLQEWIEVTELAPMSAVGQRTVACHDDFHPGNMVRTLDGIKMLDVNVNVSTVAYCMSKPFQWFVKGGAAKRTFVKAYLETIGELASPDEVDDLLLDGEVARLSWPIEVRMFEAFVERRDSKLAAALFSRYLALAAAVRTDPAMRELAIEEGILHCLEVDGAAADLRMQLSSAALARLPPLASCDGPLLEVKDCSVTPRPCLEIGRVCPQVSIMCWLRLEPAQVNHALRPQLGPCLQVCAAEFTSELGVGDFSVCWLDGLAFINYGNIVGSHCEGVHDNIKGSAHLSFNCNLADSTWHHVAILYDVALRRADLFVDGAPIESHELLIAFPVRLTTVTVGEQRGSFVDGARAGPYRMRPPFSEEETRFPKRQLHDVRIYGQTLSMEEISCAARAHP